MTHNIKGTNQTNTDTRRTAELERPVKVPERDFQVERAKQINHQLASQTAKKQAESEARRKYHAAWQEYYQKYYEHYYLAQLKEQKRQLTKDQVGQLSPRQQAINHLKKDLLQKIATGANKVKKSQHFKPILAGVIVVLLLVFLQYNQLFSAAWQNFISPGNDSSSLIIADGTNQPVSQTPTLMIPKLSVKAPITFDLNNLTESGSQAALENGLINFPVAGANAKPGQNGNTVILGHSSSDVFSGGQYKFIFVQLGRLTQGDLFYVDYNKTRYSYEVSDKKIISPSELGQLNLGTSSPYATLVTCDPPGTTFNRLLVIGQQISPNPKSAAASSSQSASDTQSIPGNPPTLFEKLFGN
jgi:sortase A